MIGYHVLVLTTSYPSDEKDWSGIFIAKLLGAMTKKGHHIKVLAPSDGGFHGRRVIDGIETVRFGYFYPRYLERLTVGGGGIPENMSKSVLARIQVIPLMAVFVAKALWYARGCEVVYANWLGAGIVGAIVNLVTSRPLIVSFRGDDGYLARDRFLWRVLTRWVSKRASRVAPVSSELVEIMRDIGVPDAKLRLPGFGVDTEMFHPADAEQESPRKVSLLFVGALVPKKGLQVLLEALEDPTMRAIELVVVGEGYYAPELRTMCTTMGLDDRTRWTGSLPPEEVALTMRKADMLCLPSFTEGSPNVVKEAMASGLPVVATRVGGIPDLVREGETGLLFEPGDVDGLRRCIAVLANDRHLRRKMGSAGRNVLTESGMSWDSTAEDFDMMFAEVLTPKTTL